MIMNKDYIWNDKNYNNLQKELYSLKDSDKYLEFNKKLVLTNYNVIGIKMPNIRKIAKQISKTNILEFLKYVSSDSFEEVILEGLVISYIKDYSIFCKYFDEYIKKIDSWAICDSVIISLKLISKNKNLFIKNIEKYLESNNQFIVRVGVVSLLHYYIDDLYIDKVFSLLSKIKNNDYYANMSVAWLISEAYSKYKDKAYNYLKTCNLNQDIKEKAIRKIIESRKISTEDKKIVKAVI